MLNPNLSFLVVCLQVMDRYTREEGIPARRHPGPTAG